MVFIVIAAFGVSYYLESQKNVDPEGSKAAIPCTSDTECSGGKVCSGGYCSTPTSGSVYKTYAWGHVRTVDENGTFIGTEFWRKDTSVCGPSSFPVSSTMNINGVTNAEYLNKCTNSLGSSVSPDRPHFIMGLEYEPNKFTLRDLPSGYECVGWEYRKEKTDGSMEKVAEGTGCETTLLNMPALTSTYKNIHYLVFKIKKSIPKLPWHNTDTNKLLVFGEVRTADSNGAATNEYWAITDSVCSSNSSATFKAATDLKFDSELVNKCDNATTPYAVKTLSFPANYSFELSNIPAGYECVGWDYYRTLISTGQLTKVTSGTGCKTSSLQMATLSPGSGYYNSHFFSFRIRVLNGTPTPTPIPPNTRDNCTNNFVCNENEICSTKTTPYSCSSDAVGVCTFIPSGKVAACLNITIQNRQCRWDNKTDGTACTTTAGASGTCVSGACTGAPKSRTNCMGDNSICNTNERCDTSVSPNVCTTDTTKVCTQVPSGKTASCIDITIGNQTCSYGADKANGTSCGTNQVCQSGACTNIPQTSYTAIKGINLKIKLAKRAEKSGYTYPTVFYGIWRDTGSGTLITNTIAGLTGNTTYTNASFLSGNGTSAYSLVESDYLIVKPEGYLSRAYQLKNITITNNTLVIDDTTPYEGGDVTLDVGSFDTVNVLDRAEYKLSFGKNDNRDRYYLDYNGDGVINILDGSLMNRTESKYGATKTMENAIGPIRTAMEPHLYKIITK